MWGAILYDLHDKIYMSMNHDEDIHTFKIWEAKCEAKPQSTFVSYAWTNYF
jgi:hypothetical protein